jgi:hypothetical protein
MQDLCAVKEKIFLLNWNSNIEDLIHICVFKNGGIIFDIIAGLYFLNRKPE